MRPIIVVDGRTLISTVNLQDRFGISSATRNRWERSNLLPQAVKLGKQRYYDLMEVERRIARGQ